MPYDPDAPTAPEMSNEDRREVPDTRERIASARRAIVAEQLRSREGIAGLRAWRGLDRLGSGVRKVRRACDAIAAERRGARDVPETEKTLGVFSGGTTRVDELIELFAGVGAEAQQTFSPSTGGGARGGGTHPEVARIAEQVRRAQSSEGEVDVFDLLTSDTVAAGAKAKWLETQLVSAIRFLETRDLADARAAAAEPPPEDVLEEKERVPDGNVPPPQRGTLAPTMDDLDRAREGESGAWFTVRPFFGGYWREQDYDVWNPTTLEWEQSSRAWEALDPAAVRITDAASRRVVTGTVRAGEQTALPMPVDAGFVPDVISSSVHGDGTAIVVADGRSGYAIHAEGSGLVSFAIEMGRGAIAPPPARSARATPSRSPSFGRGRNAGGVIREILQHPIGPETQRAMDAAKADTGMPFARARTLKRFVKSALTYSNDSSLNAVYRGGDPAGYFQRIEEHKKADCDVANTYFMRLLAAAGIPARIVSGHYVKTKDRTGAAVLSSGTGHAWVEVWDPATPGGRDGGWHKLDATPPGDPNMDEGDPDEQDPDALGEGDYGESDALSADELEQMIQEAAKELDRKEREPKERAAAAFAEQAGSGCTPEEAKQILAQMDAARDLRDREGRRIHDRLKQEFQKIVRENLREALRYEAPVRMSQGTSLEDPVEAMLGIRAGEADPTGFGRERPKVEREQVHGGLDVVLVADGSGSMALLTPSRKSRWRAQQEVVFVAMDALHEAADDFRAARVRLLSPVDIRTGLVIFKAGGAKIHLPLGADWGPKEQYTVWKALQENVGGGTPDHLGMDLAGQVIASEPDASAAIPGSEKDRVRVVLEYSDGESDDAAAFAVSIAALRKDGIIADAYRKELDGYPEWVAEHVIAAAAKLLPQRIRNK